MNFFYLKFYSCITLNKESEKQIYLVLVYKFSITNLLHGQKYFRLFTVLYFSITSPQLHAYSKPGAIFVYVASTTCEEDKNPHLTTPTFIHPTPVPSGDFHPLPRVRSQYKQRWHLVWTKHMIVVILQKNARL